MKRLTTATPAEDFVGFYGPRWREGVLSEHVDLFERAGGVLRASRGHSAGWAVLPSGKAVPVLCSEVVSVPTEDGPVSGRCGAHALADTGRCSAHSLGLSEVLHLTPMGA